MKYIVIYIIRSKYLFFYLDKNINMKFAVFLKSCNMISNESFDYN